MCEREKNKRKNILRDMDKNSKYNTKIEFIIHKDNFVQTC